MAETTIKDEGQRLNLKSFKALGGAHAVMRLLLTRRTVLGYPVGPRDLGSDRARAVAADMRFACATAGIDNRKPIYGLLIFP